MFSGINLAQIISEPTHIMRDSCKPSCIDLILTDQPNIVLDSGVRDSLDSTVKHKIIFTKINFKIPPPPNFTRKIWHFNRAREASIKKAIRDFPWVANLSNFNPNRQVSILNQTILNIMSNFVPNEVKTFRPREPEWMNNNIKNLLRKKSKVFKRYKKNGYKPEDKIILDRLRNESHETILNTKEKFLMDIGKKLANPTTGQKSYWKILNKFLNKCKVPKIPPLFVQGRYITDCKDKASIFNNFFSSQCIPFVNNSELPELTIHTTSRSSSFETNVNEINEIITGLNSKNAYGPDLISVSMIKLCGADLFFP